MRQALGETAPPGEHSDSTWRRIRSACDPLIEYLLFSREAQLPAAIRGDSPFAREFAARGPRDDRGRSLRDFDLTRRLFKYPCSYLVYSSAFAGLPDAARQYIYQRLLAILTGADSGKSTGHLSAEDRRAILEILRDTLPDLPPEWKAR
jgi:hypothetical protein